MRLKVRPIFLLAGCSLLLLLLPNKSEAVPQFARRYKVSTQRAGISLQETWLPSSVST
jgi:hypothetical protein